MANLIHCFLCLENFAALGARICFVLTLFMLFEILKIGLLTPSDARTIRSSAVVGNLAEHVGQRKLCFVS